MYNDLLIICLAYCLVLTSIVLAALRNAVCILHTVPYVRLIVTPRPKYVSDGGRTGSNYYKLDFTFIRKIVQSDIYYPPKVRRGNY